jgi:hypothetical protein
MATVYKILGQSSPLATTETDLYTVPSPSSSVCAIISSIMVCNRGTSSATFRISTTFNSIATSDKDYIYYNVPIGPGDTFVATVGMTLGANDVVRIYSSTADLSFNLFGSEIA